MLPSMWGDNQNLKLNAYKRLGVYARKHNWLMQCILFSVMDQNRSQWYICIMGTNGDTLINQSFMSNKFTKPAYIHI